MRFVGICQYDGSNYSGFQSQKNASSIQDQIELAISSIGTLDGRINYAGRTDAGVHATGQIFDFSSNDNREIIQWLKGLNSLLPNDISVSSIQKYQMNSIQDLMLLIGLIPILFIQARLNQFF